MTVAAGAAGAAETIVYPDAFMQAFATFLARQSGVGQALVVARRRGQGRAVGTQTPRLIPPRHPCGATGHQR